MPDPGQESTEVAEALNRLSAAMEKLQARYDVTERANRRLRIAVVIVLIFLGGMMYQALSPIADRLGTLPQVISQMLPGLKSTTLDPETAAAERQRLMEALSPEERARIEAFEEDQQWVSDYIAATEGFDPGATIALFLSQMAQSVKVMPDLYAEVRSMNNAVISMTEELRTINSEMSTMNDKMSSIPVLATEVQGMHAQMTALPVLATDVKGMHFYMSIMARDLDSTMGEAGRMMPWNW